MLLVARTQAEKDELFARIHYGELKMDPDRAWLFKTGKNWAYLADDELNPPQWIDELNKMLPLVQ